MKKVTLLKVCDKEVGIMRKYLTIEEIRNAEKLKAMDREAGIIESSAGAPRHSAGQKILAGAAVVAAVWAAVAFRKRNRPQ